MSTKRILRVAAAVLIAFGVQVAHGMPSRSTQTLRAVSCCRATCHHARGAAESGRCCGVAQSDADSAATTPSRAIPPPASTAVATLVGPDALAGATTLDRVVATTGPPRGRAAPLFLATHALLI